MSQPLDDNDEAAAVTWAEVMNSPTDMSTAM
jgi:hypothetical protein